MFNYQLPSGSETIFAAWQLNSAAVSLIITLLDCNLPRYPLANGTIFAALQRVG